MRQTPITTVLIVYVAAFPWCAIAQRTKANENVVAAQQACVALSSAGEQGFVGLSKDRVPFSIRTDGSVRILQDGVGDFCVNPFILDQV